MADLTLDLRYAWRRLVSSPSFAFIAIATLAAGIGVTTAVYSLLYAMMFRPTNIPDIERVVNINGGRSNASLALSWPDYQDLKSNQTVFAQTAAWMRIRAPLTGGGGVAEMIMGEAVEGSYFELLRVPAAVGRPITTSDDRPDAPAVVMLSDGLWRTRYGADPHVTGRIIRLHGRQFEIIGVAPAWFRGVDAPNVRPTPIWVPLAHSDAIAGRSIDRHDRDARRLRVKGRLADNKSIEEAVTDVARIASQLDRAYPSDSEGESERGRVRESWQVVPASSVRMHETMDRLGVPISYGLMAALALVLLIACVNIANLLLARASGRRVEMATRIAIGASRARLLRQLLTENALLCVLGGACGLFVAFALTRFMTLQFNIGRGFDFAFEPRIEWPVLLVALGATALAGLAFGLVPALQGARTDVRAAMSGTVTARGRMISGRRLLVVFQLGLSIAFLVVASVFLNGFLKYATHDPGFDLSRTATATFELEYRWKDDREAARRFLARLRDLAREQPGISAAAVMSALPVGNPGPADVTIGTESATVAYDGTPKPTSNLIIAGPEALAVLGIDLVHGRFFDDRDAAGAPQVAVVSEGTATRLFGTPDPIGRRIRYLGRRFAGEPPPPEVVTTIVGVIRNTDAGMIGGRRSGLLFVPFAQHASREFTVAVKTTGDPAAAASALSVLVRQLDDEVVAYLDTGRNVVANDVIPTRIGGAVSAGLGGLAFLLAMVGLYGVMSHLVAMRTREIGIRMALGAEAGRVVRFVAKEGAGLVVAGAVLGGLLAYWIVAFLRRLIFGLAGQELSVVLTVTAALGLVALIACWIPARRASRIDPDVALRHL
ncbi:MAG: ABC transporter permease [Vicinamibacterales bacterium]